MQILAVSRRRRDVLLDNAMVRVAFDHCGSVLAHQSLAKREFYAGSARILQAPPIARCVSARIPQESEHHGKARTACVAPLRVWRGSGLDNACGRGYFSRKRRGGRWGLVPSEKLSIAIEYEPSLGKQRPTLERVVFANLRVGCPLHDLQKKRAPAKDADDHQKEGGNAEDRPARNRPLHTTFKLSRLLVVAIVGVVINFIGRDVAGA